jgi:hypothetical protein
MAVASLEEAIRVMMTGYSGLTLVPDARITHASRVQSTVLPAITFELDSIAVQSIGSGPLFQMSLTVSCIADTSVDALAIVAQVRLAIRALGGGTVSPYEFFSAIYTGHTIEAVQVSEGDEHAPMIANVTFDLLYDE